MDFVIKVEKVSYLLSQIYIYIYIYIVLSISSFHNSLNLSICDSVDRRKLYPEDLFNDREFFNLPFSMANIINNKLECLMLFLLTFSYVLSDRFVDGRKIGTTKLVKPKGTIKTIEVIVLAFLPWLLSRFEMFFSYLYIYIYFFFLNISKL